MEPLYRRPSFRPTVPNAEPKVRNRHDTIASLPDLIRYNAIENPEHTFCVQTEVNSNGSHNVTDLSRYNACRITFSQLDRATDSCATWIHKVVHPPGPGSPTKTSRPIALYLESDVGLFIYLAALLAMDIPVGLPHM